MSLFDAIEEGDIPLLRQLIHEGQDIEQANYGETPLIFACQQKNLEAVRVLIEAGADVNHNSNYGSPLIYTVDNTGDDVNTALLIVKELIKAGANVSYRDEDKGMTAYEYAVEENIEDIKDFLTKYTTIQSFAVNNDRKIKPHFPSELIRKLGGYLYGKSRRRRSRSRRSRRKSRSRSRKSRSRRSRRSR